MIYKKYGVGILDKKGVYSTKSYITWNSMLKRCFSQDNNIRSKNHTYDDCKVCKEWYTYSNFEKWFNEHYKEGQELDKDILFEGNKIYSPETCCFVPGEINTIMISKQTKKSNLPTGVTEVKKGKYQVVVKNHGKPKRLGTYDDIREASEVYRTYKKGYLKETCQKYLENGEISKEIYEAILKHEFKETITLPSEIEEIKRNQNADILQIKDGKIINRFKTIGEAGRFMGDTKLGYKISLCCRGLKNNYKGFEWKFDPLDFI